MWPWQRNTVQVCNSSITSKYTRFPVCAYRYWIACAVTILRTILITLLPLTKARDVENLQGKMEEPLLLCTVKKAFSTLQFSASHIPNLDLVYFVLLIWKRHWSSLLSSWSSISFTCQQLHFKPHSVTSLSTQLSKIGTETEGDMLNQDNEMVI